MSRLIVVSNRVQTPKSGVAQGGLAVALSAALREHNGFWFGWSGEECEEYTGQVRMEEHNDVRSVTIDLNRQDIEEYYNGYANRTLWPLFHFRIDLAEYNRSFGSSYERVNQRFADMLSPMIEDDDFIWVHDYHLIPLGWDLRRRGHRNRIGFFLHTPWPPTRLLVSLPHHQRLVQSLFAYDVVGFHTEEWLESFRHYCEKEMGATIKGDEISMGGRTIIACAFPIGIDYDEFVDAASGENAQNAFNRMRASLQDRKLIVGVDRLDYSKGLEERFDSYEQYLSSYPEQHRNVVMVQIAPPSRSDVKTYQNIRTTLDEQTGRINGAYSHVDWTPIRYVNQGYPRDELAGIYRAAQVGLITPLRDGMNLVAKEYIAAQDPENPGVLILSHFAGAAHQLKEALLVNPYAHEEVADAINTALHMPLAERKRRWQVLMKNVSDEDVIWWREQFVEQLMSKKEPARQSLPEVAD